MLDVVVAGAFCEGDVLAEVVCHEADGRVFSPYFGFSREPEVVLVPEASLIKVSHGRHDAVCPHLVFVGFVACGDDGLELGGIFDLVAAYDEVGIVL